MPKRGKKYSQSVKKIELTRRYGLLEALDAVLAASFANFDETIDIAVRLGVDPRHADQMIRGSVLLPNGLGKDIKVLVFAKGEKEIEAKKSGADFIGGEDLIKRIKEGWFGFDRVIATPDMMGSVGKIGRILGPRGLMPNAKTGTVTFDISRAVKETKSGKINFKVEKAGILHSPMGKVSFGSKKLLENIKSFLSVVFKLKPSSSKGSYLRNISISSSMGPGVKIASTSVLELIR
jgi:large subunit ribosomal protein L1